MRGSFHPRARDEVEEAQAWYEERSLLAAAGFLQELSRALRRIGDAPDRYPIGLHGTRRILLERFPFDIIYRTAENEVIVVAVAHQKRRPSMNRRTSMLSGRPSERNSGWNRSSSNATTGSQRANWPASQRLWKTIVKNY